MPDPLVSSDSELLILVDEDDNQVGHLSKKECHDGEGRLHRAFSLFIFNDVGELLLQQRSAEKRLWPGYWSNSCCSHPRRGEGLEEAVSRRLSEELRMRCAARFLYKFSYQARYGEAGSEREVCSVYVGRSSDPVVANRHEISDWRWISTENLDGEMRSTPEVFTPWFIEEWPLVRNGHGELFGFPDSS